jgi:spore maturation protein CgeB
LKQFDFVFAASESWAQKYAKKWKVSIATLLQATNSNLFNTIAVPQNRANNLLFVGNTRGIHRSAVRTASVIRDDLEVVGKGWEKYISRKQIKAQSLTHEQVANEYKNTKVVLCDHWSDMATQGFISNRIFDALACGATVISDYVAGIENYFNNSVITYSNPSELEVILKEDFSSDSENPVSQEVADDIAKNHTFLNRAKALISEANKIKV